MKAWLAEYNRGLRSESGACTVQDEKPNRERKEDETSEEFDLFEDLAKKLLGVPKEELDEKRAEREREKRAG